MVKSGIIQNNQSTTQLLNVLKANPKQYPPLNKIQEQQMIKKYRNDRDKLNELLYMHNIRLVFNIAKKYTTSTNDFDALVSDCLYGLAIACQRFDIDKGIKFSTYATSWIFKYCVSSFYSKSNEIDRASVSLNSPTLCSSLKSNNGNDVTFENYVNEYVDPNFSSHTTIDQELSANEQISICKTLLDKMENDSSLSATDKNVFIDSYYTKAKTKDVAKKYDISVNDVKLIKNKILLKFKHILQSEYNIDEIQDILA